MEVESEGRKKVALNNGGKLTKFIQNFLSTTQWVQFAFSIQQFIRGTHNDEMAEEHEA